MSEKLRQVPQLASAPTGEGQAGDGAFAGDDDTQLSTSAMTSKREERKQRSEQERIEREHQKRARGMRNRVMIVAGVLAVIAVIALAMTRRQAGSGRVWSAEHGHWHDK